MIRLAFERFRLWRCIREHGNPYNHPFMTVMLCSIPQRVANGYIYLFEYEGKAFEPHAALSRLTRDTFAQTLNLAERHGAKRLVAYKPDRTLRRIYEHYGARREGEFYILEIDDGQTQSVQSAESATGAIHTPA